MSSMTNPLTPDKARSIAEWLNTCDRVVLAMLTNDTTLTDEQRDEAEMFFAGHEMQADLNGYADWYEAQDEEG